MTTPEDKLSTEQAPVKLAPSRNGRVYVAGPMTGIKDFNFPAFNHAAEELRTLGLTVLNPADHGVVEGATWADYLRHDIALLSTCERIHLLPGWPKSKGARLELHIAKTLGMEITTAPGAELVAEVELGEPWGSPGPATRIKRNWELSDREIWRIWDSQERTGLVGGPCPVKFARDLLANTSPQVPEDFALVPVEPTPKMIQRVRWLEYTESSLRMSPVDDDTVRSVWSDVIDAARKGE